ncbi:hypothetical protein BIU88_04750 [Chlorobaculum limnaeum]|uniref:TIR domain-containing protein n=1 Tax=Chlorobaculum limnaeum TaxID=274537 RepID=A0A1D8CX62_CHLLM|nr:toll/interleukin-1 receptor domain-containing protein [Chlorobaculum limnaeum]AOS83510.1 hypothetical protein BIU88_04750 [Chlorobaculum limnaeum]
MAQDQKDFFISYTSADRQWAEWIAWHLEKAGYSTVIQAWDFRAGGNFILEMDRATKDTGRTIAVLSERYQQALYTQPEWAATFFLDPTGQQRRLIPVRIEDVKPEGLFASLIYIDLAGLPEESAKKKLLADIQATMSSEPARLLSVTGFSVKAETSSSAVESRQDITNSAVEVFISYSHKDENHRNELAKHLNLLKRQNIIQTWYDREINAGNEWKIEIDKHLNSAQIILLLVSCDFLASDYCYDIEMTRALERHDNGEARVIPVILRPVDWKGAPFSNLKALPKDAKPVSSWGDIDDAYMDISMEIRRVAEERRSVYSMKERQEKIKRYIKGHRFLKTHVIN